MVIRQLTKQASETGCIHKSYFFSIMRLQSTRWGSLVVNDVHLCAEFKLHS